MYAPDASDPLGPSLLQPIENQLEQFLESQQKLASQTCGEALLEAAQAYTRGGKRLRPAFCYWGYVAAAGRPADPIPVLRAAASLDLLHASLLVHDDLIDHSNTRRERPSAHRLFEAKHRDSVGFNSAATFGEAAAVLLGDLLLGWSFELYETSWLPQEALGRARATLQTMRSEVLFGQYLDVAAAYRVTEARSTSELLSQAERILEYKSARYSVRRPLEIGALLGGLADSEVLEALGRFGSLVGTAFQLRDDMLGVFGDPQVTGKPTGDDLREGKLTVLVLEALARCDEAQRQSIEGILGKREASPEALTEVRQIITATGAADVVEQLIQERTAAAVTLIESLDLQGQAGEALIQLADLATRRER